MALSSGYYISVGDVPGVGNNGDVNLIGGEGLSGFVSSGVAGEMTGGLGGASYWSQGGSGRPSTPLSGVLGSGGCSGGYSTSQTTIKGQNGWNGVVYIEFLDNNGKVLYTV